MSTSHFISYHQPVLLVALWMIYEVGGGGALGDEEGGPCSWITLLQLHVQPQAPGSLPFHRSSTVKNKKKKEGKKERGKAAHGGSGSDSDGRSSPKSEKNDDVLNVGTF